MPRRREKVSVISDVFSSYRVDLALDKRSVSIAASSAPGRLSKMSQLYEKKCDCKYYDDLNDHSATLLKMELPEYETSSSSSSYIICRAIRFIGYITVVMLLCYSLWRIHVIESSLLASDRLHNLTRAIALESSRLHHNRVTRSVPVGHHADVNSIGTDKDLPRGAMLTAKNEFVPPKRRRPADEREFTYLVSSLFDKIQKMHNDSDRAHLHDNMKEVFQAWFPVFDALLPEELVEDQLESLTGNTKSINDRVERSVKQEDEDINENWHKIERNFAISKDKMNFMLTHVGRIPTSAEGSRQNFIKELSDDKSKIRAEEFSNDNEPEIPRLEDVKRIKQYSKVKKHRFVRSIADKISEESSEEKKQVDTNTVADKTSEESSEEKKPRTIRSASDKTSEESSEEKKPRPTRSAVDEPNEDISVKHRFETSVSSNSDESKSSSEEQKRRVKYNKNNKSKESSEEKEKNNSKNEKSSEELVDSSKSTESKKKKQDNEKNELFYQVVSSDQDGTKTIVQID